MFMLKLKHEVWRVFDQPIATFVYFFLCVVRILLSIAIKGFFAQLSLLQKNLLMLLAVRISSYGCTWEVWRVLKKLELRSVAPRATLTHFPCPPNKKLQKATCHQRL